MASFRLLQTLVRVLLFVAATLAAIPAMAIDLSSAEANLQVMRRIQCSAKDGEVVVYGWTGAAFSRVPGEADRRLFRLEGMNIRQCGPLANASSDAEFRIITREIMLYLDPQTGEILRRWDNPWTGKTVEVIHVSNDPVNQTWTATGRGGRPLRLPFVIQGGQWSLNMTIPLFYTNPLGGEYQEYVGGTYHATEMFNFFGRTDELDDPEMDSVPVAVGWVRLSSWLPWMEMGDRAGLMYFHTAGRKLDSFDQLSEQMRAEIKRNYPEYVSPPPLDDERRNETSWTFFKKVLDAR